MPPPVDQNDIFLTTLVRLRGLNGHLWQDVRGEQHDPYSEMAFWVLLYEDSDLRACHSAFCAIVVPVMATVAPMNFTVSYTIIAEHYEVTVETLMSNTEIREALDSDNFGTMPDTHGRPKFSAFGDALSKPKP